MIAHLVRRLHSALRETANKVTRPSAVTHAQHAHVMQYPSCAACNSAKHCQGHHIKPFNKFPELAAEPSNFITLCMDANECHLRIGHGDNFRMFNPNVVQDAGDAASGAVARAEVERRALQCREPDEP